MRTFLVTLMAVFLISLPIAETAEAKRFGGGSSFGKSFSSPKKSKPVQQQQQKQADKTTTNTTTAPKKKGFGGLMAGLLAGGIFGALLFGGAFEGLQFMDLILIAAVIFIVYKIFSMRKQAQRPDYATQGGHGQGQPYTPEQPQPMQREAQTENVQEFKPMPAYDSGWGDSAEIEIPSWFNKDAFLEGSREHFVNLQKAWDRSDWDEIRTYTSEELFNALQQERAKSPADQVTEVVSVMSELANFITQEDEVIVSINFYGWLKENASEATEFNETWHLARDMSKENADWFIVGIEQN